MSSTYLGSYHAVLIQPPDWRVDTVRRLRNAQTVTNASFGASANRNSYLNFVLRGNCQLLTPYFLGRDWLFSRSNVEVLFVPERALLHSSQGTYGTCADCEPGSRCMFSMKDVDIYVDLTAPSPPAGAGRASRCSSCSGPTSQGCEDAIHARVAGRLAERPGATTRTADACSS